METQVAWIDLQGVSTWRRWCGCALVALGGGAGCSDAPGEAPLAVGPAMRPIHQAPVCIQCDHAEQTPELIPLPAIGDAPMEDATSEAVAMASLLPPQPLPDACFTEWTNETPEPAAESSPAAPALEVVKVDDSHTAEAELLLADASPTVTGSPTGAIVTERAQAKTRRGYALAQRGANFAARSEFIQVLRMIAEAKDQKHGARRRTIALANGLRALDEADDFAPRGPELDTELSLTVIISSHRTPVAKGADGQRLMPQQLADLYFRYAQLQLGASVAGEPAGSMALHALGKLYSQLGRAEPDKQPQADRKAFALQQAALLARDDNHLAAHELGVLLAESGHYIESEHLLNQVAAKQPHPVVFRNLARVQRKLGREQMAMANEQQAQAVESRNPTSGGNVMWVSPGALARTGDAVAPAASPAHTAATPALPQPRRATPMVARPVNNVSRLPGGYLR